MCASSSYCVCILFFAILLLTASILDLVHEYSGLDEKQLNYILGFLIFIVVYSTCNLIYNCFGSSCYRKSNSI